MSVRQNIGMAMQGGPGLKTVSATQSSPIVFVVDDDLSVRESLELLIRHEGWRVMTFTSASEFLACPRLSVPSCLILDVSMPELNGLELQKRIAPERADMPIIFITGYGDVPMTVQAMRAGAVEFLTKPFTEDALVGAIRQALDGSRQAWVREKEMQDLRNKFASLSMREQQVMRLVVTGKLNKEVANELGISEITVKAHRGRVTQKMKADSLADLVNMAAKLELGRGRQAAST
jgi:FixJ family two-component response regulator